MAQEFEDLHLLALVASTMERHSNEKSATPQTTPFTENGSTACSNNESCRRASREDKAEEEHNTRSFSSMPSDKIRYPFRKTQDCHRCYAETNLAELEQRLENLRDAFSFWEYLRGYLRTNEINPQLERDICDFMEVVKRI